MYVYCWRFCTDCLALSLSVLPPQFLSLSLLGPRLWNCLPRMLCNTGHNTTSFWTFFKYTSSLRVLVHIRGFGDYALYKSTSYVLTYSLLRYCGPVLSLCLPCPCLLSHSRPMVQLTAHFLTVRASFSFLTDRLTGELTGRSPVDAFLELLTNGQMAVNCNCPISDS